MLSSRRLLKVLATSFVLVFLAPAQLVADRCELGVEPAATLLLPYFEVDPNDPAGATTLVSVSNAASAPALANVTFWTDWGVPSFNFPIFLTGYDVVTMNIGLILRDGFLPITADQASDPNDDVSPQGRDGWDGSFEGCNDYFPFAPPGSNPIIPPPLLDRLNRVHSGQADDSGSEPNQCSGQDHGDGLLRGYVTIDSVNRCDFIYPTEEGYFADGGTGVANNNNQLFGDFYLIDPARGYAQGDSLVHIQAFDGVGEAGDESAAWQNGDVTFYSRYVGYSAVDNREPLPSVFGVRYLGELGGGGGTDLIVWRDTYTPDASPIECGSQPDWWPLIEADALDFDEQEDSLRGCSYWFQTTLPEKLTPPPLPQDFACFQLASQRVGIAGENGGEVLLGYHDAGWLRLDFRQRFDSPIGQAWVVAMLSSDSQYSIGLPAAALHSSCNDQLPTHPFD